MFADRTARVTIAGKHVNRHENRANKYSRKRVVRRKRRLSAHSLLAASDRSFRTRLPGKRGPQERRRGPNRPIRRPSNRTEPSNAKPTKGIGVHNSNIIANLPISVLKIRKSASIRRPDVSITSCVNSARSNNLETARYPAKFRPLIPVCMRGYRF